MKKILPSLLITLLLVHFASCEKDDICVDGDTALLIIGFYDAEDTTEFKAVPSLRIRAIDNNTIFESDAFTDRANSPDSIFIPLRIDATNTTYEFIINSEDDDTTSEETGNRDTLTFNYTVSERFISRACGFVANYNGLDTTRANIGSDWISKLTILNENIENSNNIHVKIFH